MKNFIGTVLMTLAIIIGMGACLFGGWAAGVSNHATVADNIAATYATQVEGENELHYMMGVFINDVTDFFG